MAFDRRPEDLSAGAYEPRESRGQNPVARYFNSVAGRFPFAGDSAGVLRRALNAIFRRSLHLRFDRVLALCTPIEGRSVLDIGCGTGAFACHLASGGARHVLGIDFAPEMIRLAQERAVETGLGRQCQFIVMDFMELGTTERFDFVTAMGVMDYIADPPPFVAKALMLADRSAVFSFPKRRGFLAWQRRMRYVRRCPLFMYSRGDLEALFAQAAPDMWEIESLARDWLVTVQKKSG